MIRIINFKPLAAVAALLACVAACPASPAADELARGFQHPPPSARPWVFWFPLDGNLSSNGITADLEAMQRVGIGGVIMMETEQGTPKGPAAFGGPLWRNMFKHACAEANRLGLEINMNNDAGWCGSGGPWITPELSMQRVVWSETAVAGPRQFDAVLPQPEGISNYYRDIIVLAVPTPAGEEIKLADASPKLTASASGASFDAKKLLDGNPDTSVSLPKPKAGKPQFIQLEFPQPFRARTLTLTLGGSYRRSISGEIQISQDGKKFKKVREFDTKPPWIVVGFEEVSARFYRIVFTKVDAKLADLTIADLDLRLAFNIDLIHAKSAVITRPVTLRTDWPALPPELTIARDKVVSLSAKLRPDGRLTWDVPAGRWTILRFGHTTTGQNNYPAPLAGRGLECDKLSQHATEVHFDGLMSRLIADAGPLAGKTLVSTHIDSWEVNSQNWTPRFREEFQRLRGYDPLPFLPVMTGRVVDTLEVSERFLWDLRQTVSDLLVDNYAGHMRELAHRHGLRLSIEAYDYVPADDLTYGGRADEPMAEFWAWSKYAAAWSCTEMASSAHVYGRPILGAEAFTSNNSEKWQSHPGNIKDIGDWAFCEGINRFVVHRYALQPWADRRPGMSMGPWGLHYERTQTWWEESRAWHEYVARCQFLLQQGLFVADICHLAPENSPQRWTAPRKREDSEYNFDGCPPEVVLTRMKVKDGRIVLPDGMSYRVLVLPEVETMTPKLLRKIAELVKAGATVIGTRPRKSPSLADFPKCDVEVKKIADKLWGPLGVPASAGTSQPPEGGTPNGEHRVGKGRIVWGKTPEQVLAGMGVPRDFACDSGNSAPALRYIHRTLGDTEVYFVANKNPQAERAVCSFRVAGRRPELWWPDTGRMEVAAVYDEADGCVRIPLRLETYGSAFVVFRKEAVSEPDRIVSVTRNGEPVLDTAWQPRIQPASADHLVVTNDFTMAVWASPEADTEMSPERNSGTGGGSLKRNDALYPPPGHEVFADENHAGSGLAIGRNGVSVFEHGSYYLAPVLTFPVAITNSTHLAVVYRDAQPELFINGRLVHTGLRSKFVVHPGVGVAHSRPVTPFKGQLGGFTTANRALSVVEVGELMKSTPAPVKRDAAPALELARNPQGHCEAMVWQPGAYELRDATGHSRKLKIGSGPPPSEIAGPWDVSFEPRWGAPERATFDTLASWSEHADPGIKYFSGHATYRKTFVVPAPLLEKNRHVFLDLGRVEVIAEVKLNGKDLGILWKSPFRLDVTHALKPGQNFLEVRVVNLWINRMIGDEQLPEDSDRNPNGTLKSWPQWLQEGKPSPAGRFTFTSWRLWKKNDPLVESGLLGPVTLQSAEVLTLK